ncbi:MAG: N-acetylglucosamine-6-phosphate deacetylase [Acidimicrobiia bacterium]|nr:N-acetylglucosamine-6-phosphate deacetylase [Acidimicrobiia bacterium]
MRRDLVIADGRIASIDEPGGQRADGVVVDVSDLWLVPGFVDIQINGAFGHDFTQNPETIWDVGRRLPEHGVTAFLPTVISSPQVNVVEAQHVIDQGPPTDYLGATPIGLHLEGPMLSPEQAGTHDASHLREPAEVATGSWSPETGVRMVTLAPELPGALELIAQLVDRGVTVSVGHSNATYDEALFGFRWGATAGTHLFNAMPRFHHRDPGPIGAILSEPDVAAGVIVDGIHCHPSAVRVAWQAKGPDRFVLVTDAMAAMGMGQGDFTIGGVDVSVNDMGPRNVDGALAGSSLVMDEAVRNLRVFADCSPRQAVLAATANPARVIGDNQRGLIEVDRRADIAMLDGDLNVVATLVGGAVLYDRYGIAKLASPADSGGDR